MGATGTGKTTFINHASGASLKIGHQLQSCTTDVQATPPFLVDGKSVTLVDTPGFDDTSRSDTDILHTIVDYLMTL
jgi:predicted GTPase